MGNQDDEKTEEPESLVDVFDQEDEDMEELVAPQDEPEAPTDANEPPCDGQWTCEVCKATNSDLMPFCANQRCGLDDNQWACPVCTSRNSDQMPFCEMCSYNPKNKCFRRRRLGSDECYMFDVVCRSEDPADYHRAFRQLI